jgi:hypothetical protein
VVTAATTTEHGHSPAIIVKMAKLTVQHVTEGEKLKLHQEICRDFNNENKPTTKFICIAAIEGILERTGHL